MGTHQSVPYYEGHSGNIWSLILDRIVDGTDWSRISNFNTSRDVRSEILALIKHYKVDAQKNKDCTIAYDMLKKSTYNKDHLHKTF